MAVEERGEGVGRCILVGLHMDAVGRDLLRWALNQAARPGDRVVTVHIYRKSDLCKTNTLRLIRTLDDYLAEYESLCSKKEIVLVGRVTPGSSIQKELVKEAKLCAAMVVVLGANKKYSFGGSTCLAKYCAKKLPPTTTVVAIQNGKPVFVREAPKPPLGAEPKPVLRTVLHPSVGLEPKVIIPNPDRSARCMDFDAEGCGHGAAAVPATESVDDATKASGGVALEQRLGWPLLRRAHAAAAAAAVPAPSAKEQEPRKQSVVQWVMNLPRRSAPSESPETRAGAGLASEVKAMLDGGGARCRWFRYEELYDSTNHFSAENLIGNGGNSRVYRGSLACGQQVAIKLSKASAEASKDFLREVDIITKLQHQRILPLIGVCVEGPNLISVYSYLPRGSLEDSLHGERSKPALSWENRYKAALGIAEALSYVHSGGPRPVIHRDVKSSNILLTEEFEPQATPVLSGGDISDLMDPRLDVEHDEAEVRRMATAASLCLRRSARLRPPISQILSILRGESTASIADQGGAAELDCLDDEAYPAANVRSHLDLALLDVEDSESISSTEHSSGLSPLEEYLRERWSRSSSFD
ncbi:putative proline-rich receptor-like protein kinase PERK11 [Panicum miliaceum]|uniref:Proline-rich receptor-like protein kinase PERK11 n=1 Tax=Panicum miliaceum TaxID=4540 RepID=A0A3L6TJA2_PANMI|nr:putative proline-rich receptor-like protein kinase PERK11 [Panicum miliaceum]